VLQEVTSFSPTYSTHTHLAYEGSRRLLPSRSRRLLPSYTYTTPSLLSDIAAMCYFSSLPSRPSALCPHSSLPWWLSAARSISLTLLPMAGAARTCRRMLALTSPLPAPVSGCAFNPQSRCPLPSPSPPCRFLYSIYTIYLTRDSTAQRVCSPGAGFNPPEFLPPCGLPVSYCLATSVVRSRSTGCPSAFGGARVVFPRPGSSCSWEHKSGIRTVSFPGPWRARRIDSAVWTFVFG